MNYCFFNYRRFGRPLFALLAACIILLFGCGKDKKKDDHTGNSKAPTPTLAEVTLEISGLSEYLGKTLFYDAFYKRDLLSFAKGSLSIEEDSLTIDLASILEEDQDFYLDFFIDANGNELCDIGAKDIAYRFRARGTNESPLNKSWEIHEFANYTCGIFNESFSAYEGEAITLNGTVTASESIVETDSITRGQKIEGAIVYLQGNPMYFSYTDKDGKYNLSTKVGKDALNDGKITLVVYYPFIEENDFERNIRPNAKLGAKLSLDFPFVDEGDGENDSGSGNTDAESNSEEDVESTPQYDIELGHGRRIDLKVIDDKAELIEGCIVRIIDHGQHVLIKEKTLESGKFEVGYLFPGREIFKVSCKDDATKTYAYEVEPSTEFEIYDTIEFEFN